MLVRVLAACAAVAGCVDDPEPQPMLDAQQQFLQSAWPALGGCVGCHGSQPAIDFLAPGTPDGAYARLFAFQPPVVSLESPAASLVLTMGKHTGPALDPTAAPVLLAWLEQERSERQPAAASSAQVGPVALVTGTHVSLDLPGGGRLGFTPNPADRGLYLTDLAIIAGARGLHVTHPLFVSEPVKQPIVIDGLDRFADVDATLGPNEVLALGGGEALFLDLSLQAPLSVHFRTLEAP